MQGKEEKRKCGEVRCYPLSLEHKSIDVIGEGSSRMDFSLYAQIKSSEPFNLIPKKNYVRIDSKYSIRITNFTDNRDLVVNN